MGYGSVVQCESMSIEWKLSDVLKQHNITVYKLSSVSGIPKNTLYNLVNKKPARIDLGTLLAVLGALDILTGIRAKVSDLLVRDSEFILPERASVKALRSIGLDRREVSETFLAESMAPLDDDAFEMQLRADVEAGKLDRLIAEVVAEDEAGETVKLLDKA